jgi:DNA repair exonuclease SbcCD ATPase subunit
MVDQTTKQVAEFGNGAHVTVPKSWAGDKVKITHIPSGHPDEFSAIIEQEQNTKFTVQSDGTTHRNLNFLDASIIETDTGNTALLLLNSDDGRQILLKKKRRDDNSWSEQTEVLEMTDQESEHFDTALSILYISETLEEEEDNLSDLRLEITELKTKIKRLQNKSDVVDNNLDDYLMKKESYIESEGRPPPESLSNKISEKNDKLAEFNEKIEQLEESHDTIRDEIDKKEEYVERLDETLNHLRSGEIDIAKEPHSSVLTEVVPDTRNVGYADAIMKTSRIE